MRWDEALQLALEAARLMQKEKQWIEAADLLAPLANAHRDAKDLLRPTRWPRGA